MLKHHVVIDVTDPKGKKEHVLRGGEFTLRDRLLTRLFGKGQRMLVLVPSDRVESVSIRELKGEKSHGSDNSSSK
jgi:hypothetical protein